MPTHYESLGVPETATPEMIKVSYRRLCLTHHPDRNPGDANAARRMQVINDAHEVLGDAAMRYEYDRELRLSRMREAVPVGVERPRPPAWRPPRDDARGASRYEKRGAAATPFQAGASRGVDPWRYPLYEEQPERSAGLAGWVRAFVGAAVFIGLLLLISWRTLLGGTPWEGNPFYAVPLEHLPAIIGCFLAWIFGLIYVLSKVEREW